MKNCRHRGGPGSGTPPSILWLLGRHILRQINADGISRYRCHVCGHGWSVHLQGSAFQKSYGESTSGSQKQRHDSVCYRDSCILFSAVHLFGSFKRILGLESYPFSTPSLCFHGRVFCGTYLTAKIQKTIHVVLNSLPKRR